MKTLYAFLKKEFMDAVRSGRLIVILLLFMLFGVMNPAIAKLTPWMLKMAAESMADSGLILMDVPVDAMTSWTQFFKNIPLALAAFVLIFCDIFTREYSSGTLLLVLTRGLSRCKVVLAKTALMLLLWTLGYGLCFLLTYGYNAYFWDNGIAQNLFPAVVLWWVFGVWVICLLALFSSLLRSHTGVSLSVGGTVLFACLMSLLPRAKVYSPAMLLEAGSLLSGAAGVEAYGKALILTVSCSVLCVAASIPVMNRKQL